MAIEKRKQKCFVVMPFGEKKDADGQDIDFDDIYRFFFRKAIESLGLECIRCDEIAEAGSIHETMFQHIYQSDVVVVDITSANANVFYELGVRHALAKSVTVLIRRKGTTIPFNIQGLQVVEYDQKKFASIERAKERIQEIIKNGLKTRRNDSPVHAVLPLQIGGPSLPIGETKTIIYTLVGSNKSICLATGDIQNVKGVDVWVNSENTNMQMARPLDGSISGIIRNLGSKKENGKVIDDTIAKALSAKMANTDSVPPGEIVVTSSGYLKETHQVKLIFHAAAVVGQISRGYFPIADITSCVTNALRKIDIHEEIEFSGLTVTSILFPLMGTRAENSDFEGRVKGLLDAAIEYLTANPETKIEEVYFLTYSNRDLDVCQQLLEANPKVSGPVEEAPLAEPKLNAQPVIITTTSEHTEIMTGENEAKPPVSGSAEAAPLAPPSPNPQPVTIATITEHTETTTVEEKATTISHDAEPS